MRIFRTVAAGAAAGVLVALALRASGGFAARTPAPGPVEPRSPDQVKAGELLEVNANLQSDPELSAAYQSINAGYFDNRLPTVRLRWEPRLERIGPLIAEGFRMEGVTDGRLILLNPAIQEDEEQFKRVLCHEIVHIAAAAEREPHGPVFQGYLRELSLKGAFSGLVASDEEKEARRRDLETRAAALADAAAALRRAKSDLDAEAVSQEPRADDFLARSAAHNAHVVRHNDDVSAFNRAVEEYNLMVSYPDGLDRERLMRRTHVPQAEGGR